MSAGAINLAGKIALVTGGGRGIGATISIVLARSGADAVAFFASDAAEYITGQTLHVSGGMFMPKASLLQPC